MGRGGGGGAESVWAVTRELSGSDGHVTCFCPNLQGAFGEEQDIALMMLKAIKLRSKYMHRVCLVVVRVNVAMGPHRSSRSTSCPPPPHPHRACRTSRPIFWTSCGCIRRLRASIRPALQALLAGRCVSCVRSSARHFCASGFLI